MNLSSFTTQVATGLLAGCLCIAAASAQDDAPPPPDAAVEQLLRLGLGGDAQQVGLAVERLVRSGELDRAAEVVRSIPGRGFDAAALARLAERIEPSTRLRLLRREGNDAETAAAIELIRSRRESSLRDPATLQAAVGELTSPSSAKRSAAARRLRQAGQFALPTLLAAITDAEADLSLAVEVGQRIDRELFTAGVRQQLLYGSPAARQRAADAVLRINRPDVAPDVMLVRADPAMGGPRRDRAADWFVARGLNRPTADEAVAELKARLDRQIALTTAVRREGYRIDHWQWRGGEGGKRELVLGKIYPLVLGYREAVDAAAAVRLAGVPVASMPRLVNATLAYEVINDPDWTPAGEARPAVIGGLDPAGRRTALETAIETGNDAAILGWLRVLASSPPPEDWLRAGPGVSSLVQLVDHPQPRIRYEAALWLARAIDETVAFAGQNRVRQRLAAMRNLPVRPRALVIEPNATRQLQWNRMLSARGYGVEVRGTVGPAIAAAAGDGIDLIVLARQPADAMVLDTIDRLRRIPTASEVPMILDDPSQKLELAAEYAAGQRREEEARAAAADPLDPDAIAFIDNLAADPAELYRLGIEQRDLLSADLDADLTTRAVSPIETLAVRRWDRDGSLPGMIRTFTTPSAAAFGDFQLEVQRRRQMPTLTAGERLRYRQAAEEALRWPTKNSGVR